MLPVGFKMRHTSIILVIIHGKLDLFRKHGGYRGIGILQICGNFLIPFCQGSVSPIIRYGFFGVKETLGFTPSWLLWLRYSTFLVLYPSGITSEVGLIYFAMPYMKESGKYSQRMPNKWNFSFDYLYAAILILAFYVPGSPHMYRYMLSQRKKALSKAKSA
ncbi:hypothetical protein QQ045_025110 [Rhodiola kirilowii]